MSRSLLIPALVLSACLALPLGALAGLNEGEVRVAGLLDTQTTFYATEVMALRVPNSPGPGLAVIAGNMSDFSLTTNAWMSNSPVSLAAASSSAVDFYDTITLKVPGLLPETGVRIRIAWSVNAGASSSGSSSVLTSARAIVEGPRKQIWTRESNNFGDPEIWDPSGRVEFDFFVKAGTSETGNIKLTAAAESVAILDSENIPSSYSASPASNLSLRFLEVVSVQTASGVDLPIWTIQSTSLFDYGSGDGPVIPSDPTLKIGPSASGPGFIKLSWPSSPYELYTLERSPNLINWTPETQVHGNGATLSLDLPRSGGHLFYRLVTQIGTAG